MARDPKSPPKSQRSDRQLSHRVKASAQREPDHEAFGLEPPPTRSEINRMMCATVVRTLNDYIVDAECVETKRESTPRRRRESRRQLTAVRWQRSSLACRRTWMLLVFRTRAREPSQTCTLHTTCSAPMVSYKTVSRPMPRGATMRGRGPGRKEEARKCRGNG